MASREDLEGYINRLDEEFQTEEVDGGIWVLSSGEERAQIVVSYDPPVVVFRVNVMDLPEAEGKRNDLMTRLLELNAAGMVHGSYGIDAPRVILSDALQLENLDFNEFQATLDSISLALASHMADLATYQE